VLLLSRSHSSCRTISLSLSVVQFFIKGVIYSPSPIGSHPSWTWPHGDFFLPAYSNLWARDLPLLVALGANTLRIQSWNPALDHGYFLDTVHSYGLKVIVTHALGNAWSKPVKEAWQRESHLGEFVWQFEKYLDHPALLGWTFGEMMNLPAMGYLAAFSDVGSCGWNGNVSVESRVAEEERGQKERRREGVKESRSEMRGAVRCVHSSFAILSHIVCASLRLSTSTTLQDHAVDSAGCTNNIDSSSPSCASAISCVYAGLFGYLNSAASYTKNIMSRRSHTGHLFIAGLSDTDAAWMRMNQFRHYASAIDMWGVQIYRGRDFGVGEQDFIVNYERKTKYDAEGQEITEVKPLMILEYGIDAYNDPCGYSDDAVCYNDVLSSPHDGDGEDEDSQAEWGASLSRILLDHSSASSSGAVAGGAINSYIDESWRGTFGVGGCSGPVPYPLPGFDGETREGMQSPHARERVCARR
jgi:hypothetical protein